MADMATILLEALILGLTLGTTCLISCLPVLLAHITADHSGVKNGFITSVVFSFGRLIALSIYAILFGVAGVLLEEFIDSSTPLFIIFTIILVTFLIIYGMALSIGKDRFPSFSKKVCAFTEKNHSSLVLGILVGLFPCAPMFYMFGQAILLGANSMLLSFVFFLIFWVGTNVYIFIAGLTIGGGSDYVRRHEKVERIKWISGLILIILGIFHLLQVLNLF